MKWSKKQHRFSESEVREAYRKTGTVAGTAKLLDISYPTASKILSNSGFKTNRQGYNRPDLPISGNQCRHAREFLGMTRIEFCELSGVGKTALQNFELGKATPRKDTIQKIVSCFESKKIIFLDDGTFQVLPQ